MMIDRWLPSWIGEDFTDDDGVIRAQSATGTAAGKVQNFDDDADSESALWEPRQQSSISIRLHGEAPSEALEAVLDHWMTASYSTLPADDIDAALTITVPSRDFRYIKPLTARGFTPTTILAARAAGTVAMPTPLPDSAHIWPAEPDDLEQIVPLLAQLHAFDLQFSTIGARPNAEKTLREAFSGKFEESAGWTFVLETEGQLVGVAHTDSPEQAQWVQRMSFLGDKAAYFGYLYLDPEIRGSGWGAALVQRAHQAIDAAGIPLTLLHYAANNAQAAPFWARQGYRPLWTTWKRMP